MFGGFGTSKESCWSCTSVEFVGSCWSYEERRGKVQGCVCDIEVRSRTGGMATIILEDLNDPLGSPPRPLKGVQSQCSLQNAFCGSSQIENNIGSLLANV